MQVSGKDKLEVLIRSMQVGEKTLLKEMTRVSEIFDTREKEYLKVFNQEKDILAKIYDLSKNQRRDALKIGDSSRVSSIARYLKRLEQERVRLNPLVKEKEKNFTRAKERFELLEEQLLEVRIEIKKVEKLIQSKEMQSRVRQEAQGELMLEDRASFRKTSD